jgi:hypothetical protein
MIGSAMVTVQASMGVVVGVSALQNYAREDGEAIFVVRPHSHP